MALFCLALVWISELYGLGTTHENLKNMLLRCILLVNSEVMDILIQLSHQPNKGWMTSYLRWLSLDLKKTELSNFDHQSLQLVSSTITTYFLHASIPNVSFKVFLLIFRHSRFVRFLDLFASRGFAHFRTASRYSRIFWDLRPRVTRDVIHCAVTIQNHIPLWFSWIIIANPYSFKRKPIIDLLTE